VQENFGKLATLLTSLSESKNEIQEMLAILQKQPNSDTLLKTLENWLKTYEKALTRHTNELSDSIRGSLQEAIEAKAQTKNLSKKFFIVIAAQCAIFLVLIIGTSTWTANHLSEQITQMRNQQNSPTQRDK
jgi:sugar diacid utilization regulator